jgi:hypothetical protein
MIRTKKFTHKEYEFQTEVILNFQVERRPNGNRFHKIVTKGLGVSNFRVEDLASSESAVLKIIKEHYAKAADFIDRKEEPLTGLELELKELGFE